MDVDTAREAAEAADHRANDRSDHPTDRRTFLRRGAAAVGTSALGLTALAACSSGDGDVAAGSGGSPSSDAPGTTTGTSDGTGGGVTTPSGGPATTGIAGDGTTSDQQLDLTADRGNPPGGPPPTEQSGYFWTDARFLFVTVPVKPDGLGDWLPPGLRLAEPAEATLFVAHYPMTNFGSIYNEAAVLLHVEDDEGPARHCPWMVVDDDTALVLGRELLGFPKTMAEISLVEADGRLVGTVTRRGTELMRLEAELVGLTDEPGPVWGSRMINTFGSAVGGMRLLRIPPLPEEVHVRTAGTGRAILGRTDRDPLGDWLEDSDGTTAPASYAVADFADLSAAGTLAEEVMPFDYAFRMTLERAS
jgi:acetoacetate decarboxylase